MESAKILLTGPVLVLNRTLSTRLQGTEGILHGIRRRSTVLRTSTTNPGAAQLYHGDHELQDQALGARAGWAGAARGRHEQRRFGGLPHHDDAADGAGVKLPPQRRQRRQRRLPATAAHTARPVGAPHVHAVGGGPAAEHLHQAGVDGHRTPAVVGGAAAGVRQQREQHGRHPAAAVAV